jgi:hypothetical protein
MNNNTQVKSTPFYHLLKLIVILLCSAVSGISVAGNEHYSNYLSGSDLATASTIITQDAFYHGYIANPNLATNHVVKTWYTFQ